jgi:hypothetical protein
LFLLEAISKVSFVSLPVFYCRASLLFLPVHQRYELQKRLARQKNPWIKDLKHIFEIASCHPGFIQTLILTKTYAISAIPALRLNARRSVYLRSSAGCYRAGTIL